MGARNQEIGEHGWREGVLPREDLSRLFLDLVASCQRIRVWGLGGAANPHPFSLADLFMAALWEVLVGHVNSLSCQGFETSSRKCIHVIGDLGHQPFTAKLTGTLHKHSWWSSCTPIAIYT